MFELDHDLAQDIVDRAMAILPYNVNVMDSQGLILGSGEPERINTRHEGAQLVLANGRVVEIDAQTAVVHEAAAGAEADYRNALTLMGAALTLTLALTGWMGWLLTRSITRPLEQAVPELVELALKRGGARCDNVTVLAMEWETADEFQTTRVSTEDIEEGVFASTIQSGVADPTIEDLDDAAIEKSIAEINEAIRRTAEKNS